MKKVELIKRLFTNEEIIAIYNRNKKLEEENKTLYKKLQEIGENNFELKKKNKKLQEKVNTYSEEYGKLREEKKKLKGEYILVGERRR